MEWDTKGETGWRLDLCKIGEKKELGSAGENYEEWKGGRKGQLMGGIGGKRVESRVEGQTVKRVLKMGPKGGNE